MNITKMKERMEQLNQILREKDVTLTFMQRPDDAGRTKYGYAVRKGEANISPVFYYEEQHDSLSDQEFANLLLEFLDRSMEHMTECENSFQLDRDYALSHVQPILYSLKVARNYEQDGCIMKAFGEFGILFRVVVFQDKEVIGAYRITGAFLHYLHITEDELLSHAVENLKATYRVMSMQDAIQELFQSEEMSLPDEFAQPEPEINGILVVSNSNKEYGAASVICSDILHDLAGRFSDGSFYLLPSSVHEMLAVEENMEPEELLAMVYDVNHTQVGPEEFLSNDILHYRNGNLYPVKICRETGRAIQATTPLPLLE